jgi:preprotein translocase subunit Sss1
LELGDGSWELVRSHFKTSDQVLRARRKPMKKRSIHLEYVSILKRLATQMSGLRRGFEMTSMRFSSFGLVR